MSIRQYENVQKKCVMRALEFGVDIGWAVTQHRKYLLAEIDNKTECRRRGMQQLKQSRDIMESLELPSTPSAIINEQFSIVHSRSQVVREYTSALDTLNSELRQLNRYEEFIAERITREDIDRAREYPYYKILGLPKDNVMITCPFHPDKDPSFLIRGTLGYCFGCGAKEDTIGLMMRRNGIGFLNSIHEILAKMRGTEPCQEQDLE